MAYTEIDNPELYFQCKTYGFTTGAQSITFDNTETSMQPDMVWIKSTSNSGYNHVLNDSTRGVTKFLRPNLTSQEATITDALTSFDSNGFTLGADGTNGEHNDHNQSQSYIAWAWKKNSGLFDIVTYTGNATNRAISHSLSAIPTMIWIKNRDSSGGSGEHWLVYHASLNNTHGLLLNQNALKSDDATYFQDTTPTSSVFSIGTSDRANKNSEGNVAFLFADKQGFQKTGFYTGGATSFRFIYTGFKPAYVLIKGAVSGSGDAQQNWEIHDNKRQGFNGGQNLLSSSTNASQSTNDRIHFMSNGFKINVNSDGVNDQGSTYVYYAVASSPFTNSSGVPTNAY